MGRNFLKSGIALPLDSDEICGGVNGARYCCIVLVGSHNLRQVLVGAVPVGTAVGMLASRVGKLEADGGALVFKHVALYAGEHAILVLHAGSSNLDVSAVGSKLRFNLAVPKHQFLTDIGKVFQCNGIAALVFQFETNSAEIKAVRIYSEVLRGLLVSAAALLELHGINLLMAVTEVVGLFCFRTLQVVGVFK